MKPVVIIGIIVIAVSIGSLFFFDEIVGGAYSQGFFDNTFEKYDSDDSIIDMSDSESDVIVSKNSGDKTTLSSELNSKCGAGTVLDIETNSYILDK